MSKNHPSSDQAHPPSEPSHEVERWRRTGKFMTCGGMGPSPTDERIAVPQSLDSDE